MTSSLVVPEFKIVNVLRLVLLPLSALFSVGLSWAFLTRFGLSFASIAVVCAINTFFSPLILLGSYRWFFLKRSMEHSKRALGATTTVMTSVVSRSLLGATSVSGMGWVLLEEDRLSIWRVPTTLAIVRNPVMVFSLPRSCVVEAREVTMYRGWAHPQLVIEADQGSLQLGVMPQSGRSMWGVSAEQMRAICSSVNRWAQVDEN